MIRSVSSHHLVFLVIVSEILSRQQCTDNKSLTGEDRRGDEAVESKSGIFNFDGLFHMDGHPQDGAPVQALHPFIAPSAEAPGKILMADSGGPVLINRTEYFSRLTERPAHQKGSVFGLDTRFALPSSKFVTMFPFSTAVKLSNGCSGILLSPKHVLTSAHCIHDGKKYIKGLKKLKVGKIVKGSSKNRRKKRKMPRKSKRSRKSGRNAQQSDVRSDLPYFRWVRARKFHVPREWQSAGNSSEHTESDYAVIELRKSLGKEYMSLGVLPDLKFGQPGRRIHFSGFDGDSPSKMLYRFCKVEKQSADYIYQYCDAHEGASGSGMYIRLFDTQRGTWSRKVIGVFAGAQWLKLPDGAIKKYNVGVRITPLKYAQICLWVKGNFSRCHGG